MQEHHWPELRFATKYGKLDTYGCIVWWEIMRTHSSRVIPNKAERYACLDTTGAIGTA